MNIIIVSAQPCIEPCSLGVWDKTNNVQECDIKSYLIVFLSESRSVGLYTSSDKPHDEDRDCN